MNSHKRNLCATCLDKEYKSFSHSCIHESMAQNELLKDKFKIDSWPRWDYQMDDATLIFSKDGKARVICDMEVVGSTQGKTWEWSWGNANTPEICRSRMCAIQELGTERNWDRLSALFLPNDEYVGWECAGVANHLLGGIGVYRCPSSDSKRDDDLVDAVYVVILSARFVNGSDPE